MLCALEKKVSIFVIFIFFGTFFLKLSSKETIDLPVSSAARASRRNLTIPYASLCFSCSHTDLNLSVLYTSAHFDRHLDAFWAA